MNVSLSKQFEEYIAQQVESGFYNNASEVIREALREKMLKEQTYQAKLEALRGDIELACKQLENGEYSEWDLDSFKKELNERKK